MAETILKSILQELKKKKGIYFDLYKSYQEMTADTE